MFNRALALTRKLGFPDVILPGEAAESSGDLWGQGEGGGPEAKQPREMEKGVGHRSRNRGCRGRIKERMAV